MSVCLNCGTPLVRKGKHGPAPTKWCSGRCQSAARRYDSAAKDAFEALRALLDELAPLGLTSDCPAQRNLARKGQQADGPGSDPTPSAARAISRPGVAPDANSKAQRAASGADLEAVA